MQEKGNRINILGYRQTEFKLSDGLIVGSTVAYKSSGSKEDMKEYFIMCLDFISKIINIITPYIKHLLYSKTLFKNRFKKNSKKCKTKNQNT